jgi:hypothetical protein
MGRPTVADMARKMLSRASRSLGIADPLSDVGLFIDSGMAFPLGEQRADPLSPGFAETTPDNLALHMTADGPGITAGDRTELATRALHDVVGRNFGRQASRWLASRTEAATRNGYAPQTSYGATFGSSFDHNGVTEALVQYEWGPELMDSLPKPLYALVRAAMDAVPGLRPVFSAIRCGRANGSQQVTFELDRALPLGALQPLMERTGLGQRHAGLMSALAFVLGARFTLPPRTALITLRPTRAGVELRVDVDLDALPDPPAQLMALMRLQMTERPKSVHGLDRWLMALTPDGYPGPGTVSVLSCWVRPDLPARLALYLRPALFDPAAQRAAPPVRQPEAPPPALVQSLAEDPWAAPAWGPLH